MSEYQYFEFQALDRPLTEEQIDELRTYSTRARITSSSFINEYNWGNFKGDPYRWMEKYFDAFLYFSNWGTRWFMLRIPKKLLNPESASKYSTDESMSCRTSRENIIISFYSQEVDHEWPEFRLSELLQLRYELMHGDYRCLYLGWLLGVRDGELDDDIIEPPVPAGLGDLNAPLRSLVDFLGIDLDLIDAASQESDQEPAFTLSRQDIDEWVTGLSQKDKDAILTGILESDELYTVGELRQRVISEIRDMGEASSDINVSARRNVGHLMACAEAIEKDREKKRVERLAREKARFEQEKAENRKRYLESSNLFREFPH